MATPESRFLLLTQDPGIVAACTAALQSHPAEILPVREAGPLPGLLKRGADLLLVDLSLPDRTLRDIVEVTAQRRDLPTLILHHGSTADWDRISRGSPLEATAPVPLDETALRATVDDLLSRSRFLHDNLVGDSAAMQDIREQVLLAGPTPVTVLISGESGTGKDVVARALHHYSGRGDGPFKAINCAAIPENLIENELFGHEKGAFTDARAQTRGLFEQADGGTVFLDEIGEMPLSAQVRLLRVLEGRTVTRIGGDRDIPVDVRVVAASNRDLLAAVSAGEFRRDLYYRLKVVELALPPLRERRQDIPLLIERFAGQLADDRRGTFSGLSSEAMDLLLEYDWPGNVRELRNLVEHLVFLGPRGLAGPQDILPQLEVPPSPGRHLPVPTHKTPDQSERELIYFALLDLKREVAEVRRMLEEGGTARRPMPRPVFSFEGEEPDISPLEVDGQAEADISATSLKDLERDAIARALEQVDQNRRKAAEMLGIGERTLYRKIDEYGLK